MLGKSVRLELNYICVV